MNETFEHKGFFWLPNYPDKKIPGTLKFSPDTGILLELIGSFPKENSKQEIILGFTEKGKCITLLNSFETTRNMSFPGIKITNIVSNYLFSGPEHLETKKQVKFYQAIVRLKYLDEWLNKSEGFNINYNWDDHEITIKYKLPESVDIAMGDSFKLILNPTAKGPSWSIVQKEARITQKINAIFQSKRKKKFDDILETAFHFQELLTFFTQQRSYPLEFFLLNKDNKGKFTKKFDLYFQLDTDKETGKDLIPHDFLFPFHSIGEKIDQIVNSWFNSQQTLEACYIPYFNNFYKKNQYISDRFLNIARSLEAFHRDTVGRIDPSTRKPYQYKKRVLEVFKSCSRSFNGLLKIKNKETFAGKIKDFRNDFTHSNPILIQRDKRYLETYYLTEKLTIILTCALLKYHGFSTTEIRNKLYDTRIYNHFKYREVMGRP